MEARVELASESDGLAVTSFDMPESGSNEDSSQSPPNFSRRLRRRFRSPGRAYPQIIDQGQLLSVKLARCWRRFLQEKGSTFALAKAFAFLEISEKSVKILPFEQLTAKVELKATIQTVKALLGRLEDYNTIRHEASTNRFSLQNIDHLLKHVVSHGNKVRISNAAGDGGLKHVRPRSFKLSRYPVRVLLSAFIILGHPDAVFSGKGDYELSLADSVGNLIQEFELLIKIILEGPIKSPLEEKGFSTSAPLTLRNQLETFDKAWCSYLYDFVVWKAKDAKLLEDDLVSAACQLEISLLQSWKMNAKDGSDDLSPDMKSFQNQVKENQKLLQMKVQQLSGNAGAENMERTLHDVRSAFIDTIGCETSFCISYHESRPSDCPLTSNFNRRGEVAEEFPVPWNKNCSLSREGSSPSCHEPGYILGKTAEENTSEGSMQVTENEALVNEIVHSHHRGSAGGLTIHNGDEGTAKAKLRDMMEKAFWDGVMDTMKKEKPDYSWVLKLMKEVQHEICSMTSPSQRQEIIEAIDIDILSQVLISGTLDMDYLGRILEFALVTLQKLSAPAAEDELKIMHQKFLEELGETASAGDKSSSSLAILLVKGLHFVLNQIQALKRDISKVRIRMLEPLIKGPAGLDYLRSAFITHYGSPEKAMESLPLVKQWLSAVAVDSQMEWQEYLDSLEMLKLSTERSSSVLSPPMLRTGGTILKPSAQGVPTSIVAGSERPECKGEKVDLILRLGLLKLTNEVEGLTPESLPETLKLNFFRLRDVQSRLQKIVVICTSILVLRQDLLSDRLVTSLTDMEHITSKCIKKLSELLDHAEDVGISEIVETLNSLSEYDDPGKCLSRREVMANMLGKSLRTGDAVFVHVSRIVYLAARGVLLGGNGDKGRQLAEAALKRIGAGFLTQKLASSVEELIVVAMISGRVHRAWYEEVLKDL